MRTNRLDPENLTPTDRLITASAGVLDLGFPPGGFGLLNPVQQQQQEEDYESASASSSTSSSSSSAAAAENRRRTRTRTGFNERSWTQRGN